MPTYEYECVACGRVIEIMQSITASAKRKPDEPCPGCGQRAPIRRLVSGGGAIIFKGTGFYQTDYRSASYKQAAEAESKQSSSTGDTASKADSKTETKSEAKADGPTEVKVAAKNEAAPSARKGRGKSAAKASQP